MLKNFKKISVFICIFLLVLVLFSVFVSAVENFLIPKAQACSSNLKPWEINHVSDQCPCTYINPSTGISWKTPDSLIKLLPTRLTRTQSRDLYCFDSNGDGLGIRYQCNQNNNVNEKSNHCGLGIAYMYPYCYDHKCNECYPNDASTCILNYQLYDNLGKGTTKCLQGDYWDKYYTCHSCVNINGTGERKITILVLNPPSGRTNKQTATELVNGLLSIEPYKYLQTKKNAFTFNVVIGDWKQFTGFGSDMIYYEDVMTEKITGSPEGSLFGMKDEVMNNLVSYIDAVCPGSETSVIADYRYPLSNSPGGVKEHGGKTAIIMDLKSNAATILTHELGHIYGDLNDEYLKSPFQLNFENENRNVRKSNYGAACEEFTSLGVPRPNCYYMSGIYEYTHEIEINYDFVKTTSKSMMSTISESAGNAKFNIISCAYILEKIGVTDLNTGVKWCRDTKTPEGYKIYDGILKQS